MNEEPPESDAPKRGPGRPRKDGQPSKPQPPKCRKCKHFLVKSRPLFRDGLCYDCYAETY
jgi:hypothetical protein